MNVIRKGLKLKPLTNDYKESVNEDFKAVVGKKIYSNGSGKLFFGYEKEDDSVHLVDYNTWKKLTAKNLSNEFMANRLINAIVKGQKQFNKKVDYNMWSNKTKPSFEQRMDYFMKNGWISNINKGGIKE
jgi:NADH:ubiquinone oxidoreductase subunit